MEDTRELKKDGEKFVLEETKNEGKVYTKVIYTKNDMKSNLDYVKTNLDVGMKRKAQLENQLKAIDVIDTPELRTLLENMKKAQQLDTKEKLEADIATVTKDIRMWSDRKEEIKKAIPEFFRNGK
jgi:hypothetical protein